jgi:quinol monooxygenase YgiN
MSKNIVVFIKVKKEYFKKFGELLNDLKVSTINEKGCEVFDTYVHENEYVLIERWCSQKSIDTHMKYKYTVDFISNTKNIIEETRVFHLEDIEKNEVLPVE